VIHLIQIKDYTIVQMEPWPRKTAKKGDNTTVLEV
jgi:hypothetical protein